MSSYSDGRSVQETINFSRFYFAYRSSPNMETGSGIVAPSFSQGQEATFDDDEFGIENYPDDGDFPMDDGYDESEVTENIDANFPPGSSTVQPMQHPSQGTKEKVGAVPNPSIFAKIKGGNNHKGDGDNANNFGIDDYPMDDNYDEPYDVSYDQNYNGQGYDENDPGQAYEGDPSHGYEGDPGQGYEGDPSQEYKGDPNQGYGEYPTDGYEGDSSQGYEGYPSEGYGSGTHQGYEGGMSYGKQGTAGPSGGEDGYYPAEEEYYDQYNQEGANEEPGRALININHRTHNTQSDQLQSRLLQHFMTSEVMLGFSEVHVKHT